jgi:hypothetical protein
LSFFKYFPDQPEGPLYRPPILLEKRGMGYNVNGEDFHQVGFAFITADQKIPHLLQFQGGGNLLASGSFDIINEPLPALAKEQEEDMLLIPEIMINLAINPAFLAMSDPAPGYPFRKTATAAPMIRALFQSPPPRKTVSGKSRGRVILPAARN